MSSIAHQGDGAPPRAAVDYIQRLFDRHAHPARPAAVCVGDLSETEKQGLWRFLKRFRPSLAQQVKDALEEPACRQLVEHCQAQVVFTRNDLLG